MSEWLNVSTDTQVVEGQVVPFDLRHAKGQMLKQYKEPVLYNAGGDITKRWFVYFSYINPATGKHERIKVYGDINSFKTKKERNEYAAIALSRLSEALKNGYNPFMLTSEQRAGEVNTLNQAVPAFVELKATQLRSKTITGYNSILGIFVAWANKKGYANQHLKHWSVDQVQQYFTHARKDRRISATTHNSELATIRSFFRFWQKRGLMTINPAEGVNRIREEIALHTIYSDDQIKAITDYLIQSDTPKAVQLLQYIRFIYYACIRPKELRMLKVGDIRTSTNTILVPATASKSGRSEPVDISPGLLEVIKDMKLDSMPPTWYVFGNQAKGVAGDYADPRPGPKPVGVNYFTDQYRDVLKALKMGDNHTLYAWKHTRNVHLYMADKDLLRLMRHNRHTDPKVTMRYLRSLGLLVDSRLTDERRI